MHLGWEKMRSVLEETNIKRLGVMQAGATPLRYRPTASQSISQGSLQRALAPVQPLLRHGPKMMLQVRAVQVFVIDHANGIAHVRSTTICTPRGSWPVSIVTRFLCV